MIGPLQNRALAPRASRPSTTAQVKEETSGWDTFKKSLHFVAGGAAFKAAKFVGEAWQNHTRLQDQPQLQIERPVLFVPGFTTPVDPYLPLVEHLTAQGGNGGQAYFVRDGALYQDPQCTQEVTKDSDSQAKVFVLMPHTRYDTPPEFAAQLGPDIAAIQKFTGGSKVDAVGYSMGGISTRLFVDQGGRGIGKLLMVGTPNQGSRVGSLAHWAVKNDIKWAMTIAQHAPAALAALEWLRGIDQDPAVNPQLSQLNARWPQQQQAVEAAEIIGAKGLPTPGFSSLGWSSGDTAVERQALELPGLPVKLVSGGLTKSHETLMADADVYTEMGRFLGWGSQSDGPA